MVVLYKKKILNLETELEFLKKAMFRKPDFIIDEKNWKKVKGEVKKIRKEVFRKYYGKN